MGKARKMISINTHSMHHPQQDMNDTQQPSVTGNDMTGRLSTLTCQSEDHEEHDDKLEPDRQPLESVQLPALW